jgi:outer membrane protein insertion porin family
LPGNRSERVGRTIRDCSLIRVHSNIALRPVCFALAIAMMSAVVGAQQTAAPTPPAPKENQPRIRSILFEGSNAFTTKELARQITTKTAFWFIRPGDFEQNKVEIDTARLQNFYRDAGYLDATATFATSLSDDGLDMTLTFTINEGDTYAIETILFEGNATLSVDELKALISSTEGETVRRPTIDTDVRAIQQRYGELGFLYSSVRALRVFSETPGQVRITYQIHEGERYRIGKIAVRGNTRTKDKVVRRALRLYPPDDWFNINEAREAEKRLRNTKIFSSARVIPVGNQPDVRDAVIDVTETDKAGDFLFALGVTSNSGLVGSVVLDLQNFDLSDPPRDSKEFWAGRAFFGGGQRLRIELQPGTQLSRFRIDFTEPFLYDQPLRFDANLYAFTRGRDGYGETRTGLAVSFGKRFETGRLTGWSGELAFRTEAVTVDDLQLFSSSEIRNDKGSNLLLSVKASVARDRTDSRFVPTDGDRIRLSAEQFIGDRNFAKLTFDYDWYKTLRADRMDRKHVLHLQANGGAILGDSPVFERFFAGGTGSIRGFAFRGVGEYDGIDKNNIGGDFMLLLGAEYSYPIIGDKFRGHVFLDTGAVGQGPMRAAIGTGVRFTLDIIGPVPIELNLAMPVSSDRNDDQQIFSFVLGGLF